MRPDLSEFGDDIETAVERYGYQTPTEFVRDAVRRRLEELDTRGVDSVRYDL